MRPLTCHTPQVPLQSSVNNLSLTITLRAIGSRHMQSSLLKPKELLPEWTSKNFVSVTDYSFRSLMKFENVIKIELSYCHSRERVRQGKEMSILAQPVHYYQNCIFSLRTR